MDENILEQLNTHIIEGKKVERLLCKDVDNLTFIRGSFEAIGKLRAGEITEERINESVRRILLTKLKYGVLDLDYNITVYLKSVYAISKIGSVLGWKFDIDSVTKKYKKGIKIFDLVVSRKELNSLYSLFKFIFHPSSPTDRRAIKKRPLLY